MPGRVLQRTALLLVALHGADGARAQHLRRPEIVDFAGVGDLDADGRNDVFVRTQFEAYAVSGRAGRRLLELGGLEGEDACARDQRGTIAALGDVDGDARPDFALAWMPRSRRGTCLVRVHSGRDGDVLAEIALAIDRSTARPSASIAAAGDLDGDGRSDFVVGEPWHDRDRGRARAYSSSTWKVLWSVEGRTPHGLLGIACTSLGEQDGDGRTDLAISAPSCIERGTDRVRTESEIVVVSGIDGSVVRTIRPNDLGLRDRGILGRSLLDRADVDGDTKRDLVCGWTLEGWVGGHEPSVLTVSPVTARAIVVCRGAEGTFDLFGASIANVGDVDGDGEDDLLIGDPEANVGFEFESPDVVDAGRVKLYSGRDGRVLRTWRGQDHYGLFGSFVAGAGDLDGDRVPDVWIAELSPPRLHAFSARTGSYLRRIDLETLESPAALGALGR